MAALDGLDAERGGQVGLAGADGTDQDDVARGVNPGAAGELLDASTLETVGASPVELRERLSRRQSRGVKPTLDCVLGRMAISASSAARRKPSGCWPSARAWRASSSHSRPTVGQFEHAGVRPHGGQDDIDFVVAAHAEYLATSSSAS